MIQRAASSLCDKNLRPIVLIIILILTCSCGNNDVEPVASDRPSSEDTVRRTKICGETRFNKKVFEHQNILSLFECVKWDLEYPNLFKALASINKDKWDHLILPLDEVYISNSKRRNQFFKSIRRLDEKRGLGDLSRVLGSLMGSNFYDALFRVLTAAKNPSFSYLSKEEIKNFLSLLNLEGNIVVSIMDFFESIHLSLIGDEKNLQEAMKELMDKPEFMKLRTTLISHIANGFIENRIDDFDKNFFSSLMGAVNQDDEHLFQKILQDDNFDLASYNRLLRFSSVEYPGFINDLEKFQWATRNGMYCSMNIGGDDLYFDAELEFQEYIDHLSQDSYPSFLNYNLARKSILNISSTTCGWDKILTDLGSLDLLRLATRNMQLLSDEPVFNLVQYAHKILRLESGGGPSKDNYITSLLTSSFSRTYNLLLEVIYDQEVILSDPIFYAMKDLDERFYKEGRQLLEYFLGQRHKLQGLAKVWSLFSPGRMQREDIQAFLVNIIDTHFRDTKNYIALFDFYNAINRELYVTIPIIANRLTRTDEKREKTFQSLLALSESLQGKDVLLDLEKFFSRDQIIKTIQIISNGSSNDIDEDVSTKDLVWVNRTYQSAREPVTIIYQPNEMNPQIKACAFAIKSQDFFYVVKNLPEECEQIKHLNFPIQVFSWLKHLDKDIHELYGRSFLSKDGIFDKELQKEQLFMSLAIEKLIRLPGIDKGGMQIVLKVINDHLFNLEHLSGEKKGYIDSFDQTLKGLNGLLKNEPLLKQNLLEEITGIGASSAKINMLNLSKVILDYSDWTHRGAIEKQKYDCKTIESLGGNPCPNNLLIKKTYRKLMNVLLEEYGQQDSLLERLIDGINPELGIDYPYKSKKLKNKVLTLEEFMNFLFVGSDKKYDEKVKWHYLRRNKIRYKKKRANLLERTDVVLRDISFHENKVGAFWQNDIARSDNIKKDVDKNYSLLKLCSAVKNCGGKLNKNEQAMTKNVIETYPSIIRLIEKFKIGQAENQGFEQLIAATMNAIINSSGPNSRDGAKTILFLKIPKFLDEEALRKHSGRALIYSSNISLLPNLARLLRDRLADEDMDYLTLIKSNNFKRLNTKLPQIVDFDIFKSELYHFLKKETKDQNGPFYKLIDKFTDWVSGLNYTQIRNLEEVMVKFAVLSTYIGSDEIGKDYSYEGYVNPAYEHNNLNNLFMALEDIFDFVVKLDQVWPKDLELLDTLNPLNKLLSFLIDKLDDYNEDAIKYHQLLNKTFSGLNNIFLRKNENLSGLKIITSKLSSQFLLFKNAIAGAALYVKRLHYTKIDGEFVYDKNKLKLLGQNLTRLIGSANFRFDELYKYFEKNLDVNGSHYLEIFDFMAYLSSKSQLEAESRFYNGARILFSDSINELQQFFLDVFDPKKLYFKPRKQLRLEH